MVRSRSGSRDAVRPVRGVAVLALVALGMGVFPTSGAARPAPIPTFGYTYGLLQVSLRVTQHWEGTGPLPGDTYVGTDWWSGRRNPAISSRRTVGALQYNARRRKGAAIFPVPMLLTRSYEEVVTRAATQGGVERCANSEPEDRDALQLRLQVDPRNRRVRVRYKVPPYALLGFSGCEAPVRAGPIDAVTDIPVERFFERRFGIVLTGRLVSDIVDRADPRRKLTSTLSWNIRVNLVRLLGVPARYPRPLP